MRRPVRLAAVALLALAGSLRAQDAPGVRYLEVPLKGGIGKEITAPGIRNALRLAQAKKAKHVVFLIDTPGGLVADARAIGKVLDDEKGDLVYSVIIQRAFSAGMYIVARADHVYYTSSGASGAAVSFHTDVDTGNAQVDAKMNAAWAADLVATAEAHGQSGAAYRAMVIQDACLYSTKDKSGKVTLSDQRGPGTAACATLDTADTIFAPTARLACDIGLGTMLATASPALIADALHETWTAAAPAAGASVASGARAVESCRAECEKHRAELKRLDSLISQMVERYKTQLKIAAGAAPRLSSDIFTSESGSFTPASQVRWRQATDAALREYGTAEAILTDVQESETRFSRTLGLLNKAYGKECDARGYGGKPEPIKIDFTEDKFAIADQRSQIQDVKSKLAADRLRTHK